MGLHIACTQVRSPGMMLFQSIVHPVVLQSRLAFASGISTKHALPSRTRAGFHKPTSLAKRQHSECFRPARMDSNGGGSLPILGAHTQYVIGDGLVDAAFQVSNDKVAMIRLQRRDGSTVDVELRDTPARGVRTLVHR